MNVVSWKPREESHSRKREWSRTSNSAESSSEVRTEMTTGFCNCSSLVILIRTVLRVKSRENGRRGFGDNEYKQLLQGFNTKRRTAAGQ